MILKNRRIFIIEDDIKNRAVAQIILENQGAVTAFERWGIDAVERLLKFMPIDVILLDLMFPNNITGYDIFAQIRMNKEFDEIPIVAVSATEISKGIQETQKMGFSGFISKPLDMIRFPQQVLRIINGENIWGR